MPTEDDKNTTNDENKPRTSLLLQFTTTSSPDPLLLSKELTTQLSHREVKEIINSIGDIQKDPTKSKRSKVSPDPEQTQSSPSEKLLTFFRSNTEKSPRPSAGLLLEKGAEATAEKKPASSKKAKPLRNS